MVQEDGGILCWRDQGVCEDVRNGQLNRRRKSRQNSSISNFCRHRRTWNEECTIWSSCCSRCTQRSRVMRQMTLLPTRGTTRWRDGEDCRNAMIRRQEEEHGTIIFLGRCSLLEVQARIKRWESYLSNVMKKLKDKVDDENKLAGLA